MSKGAASSEGAGEEVNASEEEVEEGWHILLDAVQSNTTHDNPLVLFAQTRFRPGMGMAGLKRLSDEYDTYAGQADSEDEQVDEDAGLLSAEMAAMQLQQHEKGEEAAEEEEEMVTKRPRSRKELPAPISFQAFVKMSTSTLTMPSEWQKVLPTAIVANMIMRLDKLPPGLVTKWNSRPGKPEAARITVSRKAAELLPEADTAIKQLRLLVEEWLELKVEPEQRHKWWAAFYHDNSDTMSEEEMGLWTMHSDTGDIFRFCMGLGLLKSLMLSDGVDTESLPCVGGQLLALSMQARGCLNGTAGQLTARGVKYEPTALGWSGTIMWDYSIDPNTHLAIIAKLNTHKASAAMQVRSTDR
jgi:hypothetical protein